MKLFGISLIELVISLSLSSCIMLMLLRHYLQITQHTKILNQEIVALEEEEWVTNLIRDRVKKAGFTPCLNIRHLESLDQRNGRMHLMPWIMEDNAERFTLQRMSSNFALVHTILAPKTLKVSLSYQFNPNYPILIADCMHAEVVNLSSVIKTKDFQLLTLTNSLAFSYQAPVYIGEWIEESFFIKKGSGLFYNYHHTDELTSMVKTMNFMLESNKLLHITLGFEKQRTLKISTMMRAE